MGIKKKLSKTDKKHAYNQKLCRFLDEYSRVLIAEVDNVGSSQLAAVRRGIRGESEILMGKNTLIRRCIKVHAEATGNDKIKAIIPLLQGNVGLILTKADLKEVREEVAKYKVGAPARVGLVAPSDVVVPPGNTGLDPSQTSFFQVLNIPTKINKGSVEIVAQVDLIKKGDKVGSSEAALLAKLGIRPFSYGLVITNVYDDGSVFSPEVLDLTDEDLMEKFASGVSMVASLSLAISYPTMAAAPHMFLNGYKNVLAVAVETDYSYPHADQIKEHLKYRDWAGLHYDLFSQILSKMDEMFDMMRGPKSVCLSWRRKVLLTPGATVESVTQQYRTLCREGWHSDADSDDYLCNDAYDIDGDEDIHWSFCMYIKDLKRFAAAELSGGALLPP